MDSLDAFCGTYNERLIAAAQKKKVPISGTFELLPMCNMKCKMCYIQHVPQQELQPIEFWADAFDQAIHEGMLYPLITGGEPFLYPGFEQLYEKLWSKPVHMCINTNATLLDRERVAWLAQRPPRRLNISLYGASDETYSELCGNPDGFAQVIHAFDLLKEYGILFRVHSVMMPENVKDYQKIKEICNRYQVSLSMANYMFPSYRKDEEIIRQQSRFSPKELAKRSLVYLQDRFSEQEKEYRIYLEQRCEAFIKPEIFSLYGNNQVVCKGGSCVFWVDWRGNVSGCGVHNQYKVDLHKTTFADAWKRVVEQTDSICIAEKCKTCKYRCICPVCAASCFCETGTLSGTPEYLCEYCEEYAKLLFRERSRILGEP